MIKKINKKTIDDFIKKSKKLNMIVIGDIMLDRYIWGNVNRISPEAPIPVVEVTNENSFPGGAANVARNLSEFTNKSSILAAIGNDDKGLDLIKLLKKNNIDSNGVIKDKNIQTITKTRIICNAHHIVRIDREKISHLTEQLNKKIISNLKKIIKKTNAIIIQDYGKGNISQELFNQIVLTKQNYNPECIITIDPNPKNKISWQGATTIKPNRLEAEIYADFFDIKFNKKNKIDKYIEMGKKLFRKWNCENILITLGSEGMCLLEKKYQNKKNNDQNITIKKPFLIPAQAHEVYDVSGAGDTCIAFYTMAIASGFTPQTATLIANHAASIVVGKIGTAKINISELKSFI